MKYYSLKYLLILSGYWFGYTNGSPSKNVILKAISIKIELWKTDKQNLLIKK